MANQPGVWGIDLGQCALKAVRIQEVDGELQATAFDYVEHPKILSQPDADPDQLTREALEKFLSRNTLRGDLVAISVPGQSGLARFVKLPPVEERKIGEIVRFEAKQQIPFNLDEVVWDFQKIGSGNVTGDFSETEIGLFAMKRDMVSRYLQHFKEVGVEVHLVQMAPLALCNYVSFDLLGKDPQGGGGDEEDKRCVVALDIGADSSSLVVTDGGRIIWQRPIPLGGNHFTRALTKDFKLTFAKAEHLKRNATKPVEKGIDLKKVLASLKPVLNDFAGEVQRSLGFFTNSHRDAEIEYMVGLGNAFRLPGLQRFLGEKLQLEVRKLTKFERLTGEDSVLTAAPFNENILSFAVAYGLSIQGLKRGQLQTNLLPQEIRVERLVRAKKPWAAAAAAVLFLGLGGMAFSYYLDERTYGSPVVVKAMDQSSTLVKKAKDADAAFDAAKKEAQTQEAAVKSIVAGQPERTNWLQFIQFLNTTIPLPDCSNLPQTGNPYRAAGERAYALFKAQQEGRRRPSTTGTGAQPDAAADVAGRYLDELVQFNIEGVDARFCDDLAVYWREGPAKKDPGLVRPNSDATKPPEGKGWVVEVRGFTFNNKADRFILDTFVENIARFGEPNPPAASGGAAATPAASGAADTGSPEAAATDKGPVINRISHVILYMASSAPTNDTSTFTYINKPMVPSLVSVANGGTGAAGAGGGGGYAAMMSGSTAMAQGGGMSGAAGASSAAGGEGGETPAPSREAWTPLAGGMGGAAGAMPGMAGMSGMSGMAGKMSMPGASGAAGASGGMYGAMSGMASKMAGMSGMSGMAGMSGAAGAAGATAGATPGAAAGPVHTRTEFVILFIWKEPTPSDALRGIQDTPPPSAAAQ